MKRANPNPNEPSSFCEECALNPWKYRCPGCSIRCCSLPCVNSHKRRTGCTGKRDAHTSNVIPISRFNDDLLISDYKLLEEVKRFSESSRRMLDEASGGYFPKLPRRLRMLRNAAQKRRTLVLFMAKGMSKREMNQSRFSERDKSILWTVEWRLHSADAVLIDHSVSESVSLSTVVEKHLIPSPWNDQLRPYRDARLDDLKFFLRKNPKGSKTPFRELDIKAPLRQQLANTVILEYPVIHVFLPSESYDFEVEQPIPSKTEGPSGHCDAISSPKGRYFTEEEVEEGEVSDYASSAPRHSQVPGDVMITEKAANSDFQKQKEILELSKIEMKAHEDANFDFDKELRDMYSDFMGEINTDDFLCFDGIRGLDVDDEFDDSLFLDEELLRVEELEEGEISG